MPFMDISVIIVNFKSRQFLKDCLFSLQKKLASISFEFIIINNDEEALEESFLTEIPVRILNMPSNLGFAKACNTGAEVSHGRILFFLNPDTQIIDMAAEQILKKFNEAAIGIVAPKLILPNKKMQPWSAGRRLTLGNLLLGKLGLSGDISLGKKQEFDWVSGAAFLVPKQIFKENEGFDEKFFMYFEDMDLCLRIKLAGFKIVRLEDFTVLHIGGQSYASSQLQKKHYYLSQDYYLKKHFGFFTALLATVLRRLFLILK